MPHSAENITVYTTSAVATGQASSGTVTFVEIKGSEANVHSESPNRNATSDEGLSDRKPEAAYGDARDPEGDISEEVEDGADVNVQPSEDAHGYYWTSNSHYGPTHSSTTYTNYGGPAPNSYMNAQPGANPYFPGHPGAWQSVNVTHGAHPYAAATGNYTVFGAHPWASNGYYTGAVSTTNINSGNVSTVTTVNCGNDNSRVDYATSGSSRPKRKNAKKH